VEEERNSLNYAKDVEKGNRLRKPRETKKKKGGHSFPRRKNLKKWEVPEIKSWASGTERAADPPRMELWGSRDTHFWKTKVLEEGDEESGYRDSMSEDAKKGCRGTRGSKRFIIVDRKIR